MHHLASRHPNTGTAATLTSLATQRHGDVCSSVCLGHLHVVMEDGYVSETRCITELWTLSLPLPYFTLPYLTVLYLTLPRSPIPPHSAPSHPALSPRRHVVVFYYLQKYFFTCKKIKRKFFEWPARFRTAVNRPADVTRDTGYVLSVAWGPLLPAIPHVLSSRITVGVCWNGRLYSAHISLNLV